MIVVIADDLTGAAELAGIACSYGLQTELIMEMVSPLPSCDVLVMATDMRSMTEPEAVACSRSLSASLAGSCVRLFKKTDSALRGHIMAELSAMLAVTSYDRVLFIPANPSKNRIIDQGVYYVDGKPISETAFSYDPEFPAFSSSVGERFPEAAGLNVWIPDATSTVDIRAAIGHLTADTLLAGAADLFEVWLQGMGYTRQRASWKETVCLEEVLVVCGSTQSRPTPPHIHISPMPKEVYEDVAPADVWMEQAVATYEKNHTLALTIPHGHLTGREVAVRLRQVMADVVAEVVSMYHPSQLVIEGGATAYCCLKKLGWHALQVKGEVSPGVVQMVAPVGTVVTLKPGSYEWGRFEIISSETSP